MATINIQITATLAQLSTFADELGYVSEVVGNIELGPVPNPETKQQFLERVMKDMVVQQLYRRKAQAIDSQVREEKETEKQAIRAGIEGAVSVTSKA
jgi:hypothetical protein